MSPLFNPSSGGMVAPGRRQDTFFENSARWPANTTGNASVTFGTSGVVLGRGTSASNLARINNTSNGDFNHIMDHNPKFWANVSNFNGSGDDLDCWLWLGSGGGSAPTAGTPCIGFNIKWRSGSGVIYGIWADGTTLSSVNMGAYGSTNDDNLFASLTSASQLTFSRTGLTGDYSLFTATANLPAGQAQNYQGFSIVGSSGVGAATFTVKETGFNIDVA